MNEVQRINVPLYDELSVISIWPMMQSDQEFLKLMPSKLPKGRVPDREYFFNCLNTIHPEFVQQIVRHAQDQRNTAANETLAAETIEITDEWWD